MQELQGLNTSLDSLDKILQDKKMDSGFYYSQLAGAVELRIKNFYFADTINLPLGQKMDAYKVMRRKLEPLAYDYQNLIKGIEATKNSIALLSEDIENGNGKREKYDEFVQFEANKVDQLLVLNKEYQSERETTLRTFYELHDELDAFSMELAEKAKNKK